MLFINNNIVNCCFQKTFLFQKLDSNATILGLKKNCPFTRGSLFQWKCVEGIPYNKESLYLKSFFFQLWPKGLLIKALARGLVEGIG